MKKRVLSVAVVDDHTFMRDGIVGNFERMGHKATIVARHGGEYLSAWEAGARCDLAIVDLCMPVMDGWATIAHGAQHQPDVRFIAITVDPHPGAVRKALKAGAHAVMSKTAVATDWEKALADVMTSGYHHNELMHMVLSEGTAPGSPEALRQKVEAELTRCELRFLMEYTAPDEPSLAELAERHGVKLCTVESHRRSVVEKTGAHRRLAMFRFTQSFGLR
ncbi:MAG: response regulator [Flavobacteriales bacterium]|nr:response regulator [Flavobacteriales bacterium]